MSHRSKVLLVACVTCFGLPPFLTVRPAIAGVARLEPKLFSVNTVATVNESEVIHQPHGGLLIAQTPTAKPSSRPTLSSGSNPQSILLLGSQGDRVRELQTLLKQLGYYNHSIDGIFGDRTKLAVVEFQKQMSLPVDGQVGTKTFQELTEVAQKDSSEAGTQASSGSATDTLNEGSEESPVAVEASASTETTAPRKGVLWWVLVLLLAASTLTGVFFYELKRSKKRLSIKKPSSPANSYTAAEPLPSPDVSVAPAHNNGANPNTSALVLESGTGGTHSSNAMPATETTLLSETTRLPKVNIAEELVLDLHNPDPGKRRKAIWDLGQHGNSEAIQPLVDLMMDSDSSQRSLILAAISEIGIRTLKPMNRALLISLQDRSSDVRKNAIRDITRIYDQISQVSQLLAHAASDPDSEVQETARWALGQLNRIRGLPDGTIASLPDIPKPPEQLPDGSSS
jgi:hypothetical protein